MRNVTTGQNPGNNASPGDTLEYKILPNYTGSSLLSSLKVTDTIPTGTTFVSASPAQTSGPDPLVWNLGSNTAGVPGVGVLCPVETELDAEKDTHITQNDGDENKNYGASDMLETANETNKDIAGLLRFDLSSIPPGASLAECHAQADRGGRPGDKSPDRNPRAADELHRGHRHLRRHGLHVSRQRRLVGRHGRGRRRPGRPELHR